MPSEPMNIQEQGFRSSLFGFDKNDVLAYLNALDNENRQHSAEQEEQIAQLQAQLDKLRGTVQDDPLSLPWVKELLASGQLAELDRPTVAAAIREIRVYEGNRMEIDYLLPEGCRALLEG